MVRYIQNHDSLLDTDKVEKYQEMLVKLEKKLGIKKNKDKK